MPLKPINQQRLERAKRLNLIRRLNFQLQQALKAVAPRDTGRSAGTIRVSTSRFGRPSKQGIYYAIQLPNNYGVIDIYQSAYYAPYIRNGTWSQVFNKIITEYNALIVEIVK